MTMVTTRGGKVKTVKISTADFADLDPKDGETLYFVSENGDFDPTSLASSEYGEIYLGETLLSKKQLQADWEQDDDAEDDYINNKPNIWKSESDGIIECDINNVSIGGHAHAEGEQTCAIGANSHAEGWGRCETVHLSGISTQYTPGIGDTFSEGDILYYDGVMSTVVSVGRQSVKLSITLGELDGSEDVLKLYSAAIGDNSHVEGECTFALNGNEHAEGQYNISRTGKASTIHTIGIGRDDSHRANAIEVLTNGSVLIKDVGSFDGTNGDAANSLQEVISGMTSDIHSYTIASTSPDTGFLTAYQLTEDGTAVGAKINIPKDFLVKSGEIIDVVEYDGGYYNVEDTSHTNPLPVTQSGKYLDFVVNVQSGTATDQHIYILVNDLVDVYSAGNGLTLSGNTFSVVVDSSNANGLSVGASGVALDTVVASSGQTGGSNGAMTAQQAEKLANIQEGAQANVKPNWEAAESDDAGILNKPNIKRGGSSGYPATAVSEGNTSNNVARGQYSHAEGSSTRAIGNQSHAEGNTTFAIGDNSHAEGQGSTTTIQVVGSGTSYTYTASNALEIGDVLTKNNLYAYVTAIGDNNAITTNTTIGDFSESTNVFLWKGVAYNSLGHVEGYLNTCVGLSHAEGGVNKVNGGYSHVEGSTNTVIGSSSHAEGYLNVVKSNYSHAEGAENTCVSGYSHVEGRGNNAVGSYTHAEGVYTTARGNYSHTEGSGSITESSFTVTGPDASGVYTTSAAHGMEMSFTIVRYNGTYARVSVIPDTTHFKTDVALGATNELQGVKIDVFENVAVGNYSHTEGRAKSTIGSSSHAEGLGTVTYNESEHAEGRYNKSNNGGTDATRTQHSVGIGTGTGRDRKNAFEIMRNGDMYLYGAGGYDGTNPSASQPLQNLVNKKYMSKSYDKTKFPVINSTDVWVNSYYFMDVVPTSSTFTDTWWVKYRMYVYGDTSVTYSGAPYASLCHGVYDCYVCMSGAVQTYSYFNNIGNTSYRPIYTHNVISYDSSTKYANRATYPTRIGFRIASSYVPTVLPRTAFIEVLDYEGCEVTLRDTPIAYDNLGYTTYYNARYSQNGYEQGLQESGDANDTTTTQLGYTQVVAGTYGIHPYSLIMQDGDGRWQAFVTNVPTTQQPNNTNYNKTKNTSGFRLGSRIYYVYSSVDYVAGSVTPLYALRQNMALVDLRYSLNIAANSGSVDGLYYNKPVYIVGTVHSDGLFYLDTPWWTQTEPTTEDGKIYIKIADGAYGEYTTDLSLPRQYRADLVFDGRPMYFKDGQFREYFQDDGVEYLDRVHVGANGLLHNSLCAFNTDEELVSLIYPDPKDETAPPVANLVDKFPYCAKIYYYTGSSIAPTSPATTGTDVYGLTIYSSYKHVNMSDMLFAESAAAKKSYMGIVQSGGTDYIQQSALFLNVEPSRYWWMLHKDTANQIIVPYKNLDTNEVVIRLGCHNSSSTTDTDWYSMNLEDNNPMYKLELDDSDDQVLVEYGQSLMYDVLGDIETALDVIISGQSGGGGGGNS